MKALWSATRNEDPACHASGARDALGYSSRCWCARQGMTMSTLVMLIQPLVSGVLRLQTELSFLYDHWNLHQRHFRSEPLGAFLVAKAILAGGTHQDGHLRDNPWRFDTAIVGRITQRL